MSSSFLNRSRLYFVAILFASLKLCFAQATSGLVTFSFDSTTPILDLTGTFPVNASVVGAGGQETPISTGISLTQDSRGRLRGSGTAIVSFGNSFLAASYTATGTVTGGGTSPTRVTLTIRLSGEGLVGGENTRFRIFVRYVNLIFNSSTLALGGTTRGTANFSAIGNGTIRSDVSVALPANMTGSWHADLNIVALQRLGGSGTITLSNGRILQGNLTGTFSSSTGLSRVKFIGINDSKGVTATFTISTTLQTLRGRILGQTVVQ
jgi:hypothetical protein